MSLLDVLMPASPPEPVGARLVRLWDDAPAPVAAKPPKPPALPPEEQRERRRKMNLAWTKDWRRRNRAHINKYKRERNADRTGADGNSELSSEGQS